jgi:hypothetical protein
VEAATPALGREEGEVLGVFQDNQAVLEQDLLDANPVGQAILELTRRWKDGEERRYRAGELLKELEKAMEPEEARVKPEGWPKTPEALAKSLPRLQTALRSRAVVLKAERDLHLKHRVWIIRKGHGGTSATSQTSANIVESRVSAAVVVREEQPQHRRTTAAEVADASRLAEVAAVAEAASPPNLETATPGVQPGQATQAPAAEAEGEAPGEEEEWCEWVL